MFYTNRMKLKKKIERLMAETDNLDEMERLSKIRDELSLINRNSFPTVVKITCGAAVTIGILLYEKSEVITTKSFGIGTRLMD